MVREEVTRSRRVVREEPADEIVEEETVIEDDF
jgi:hypothetical protein